jgi:hypothetical protein
MGLETWPGLKSLGARTVLARGTFKLAFESCPIIFSRK